MAFALKFISGKYQGGEFPLPEEGELLIGRSAELDLVLAEEMVSRKHAKLSVQGAAVWINDLGSTNGTFVNGEKVRRAELKLGDRILIGTSIVKLIDAREMRTAADAADPDALKTMLRQLGERPSESAMMSGELEDVPLPDLLQLFATNKKGGVLSVSGAHQGKVYIKQGQLVFAAIEGEAMHPMKALCRMVAWEKGFFQLEPWDEAASFPVVFEESTESILIEALRQTDEIRRLQGELPPLDAAVTLAVPLVPKLSELSASELETLQLAINFGTLGAVVDRTPGPDHEAYVNLHKLLREGYLEV